MKVSELIAALRFCHQDAGVFFMLPDGTLYSVDDREVVDGAVILRQVERAGEVAE